MSNFVLLFLSVLGPKLPVAHAFPSLQWPWSERDLTVGFWGIWPLAGSRQERLKAYDDWKRRRQVRPADVYPNGGDDPGVQEESTPNKAEVEVLQQGAPGHKNVREDSTSSSFAEAIGTDNHRSNIPPPDPSDLSPIVFVHGMVGAEIRVKLDKRKSPPHFYCTKNAEDYLVWFDPSQNMLPFEFECWADTAKLHWKLRGDEGGSEDADGMKKKTAVPDSADEELGFYYSIPDVQRPLPPIANVTTGEEFPPLFAGASPTQAYNWVLWGNLTSQMNYTNKLGGLVAYDWRKGYHEHAADGTFEKTKRTIDFYYDRYKPKKIVLNSVSMGATYMLWFFKWIEETMGKGAGREWKSSRVEVWISWSGVFAGAPEMVSEAIMPTDRDTYGVTTKFPFSMYITKTKIRDIVGTWAGPLAMFPQTLDDHDVLWAPVDVDKPGDEGVVGEGDESFMGVVEQRRMIMKTKNSTTAPPDGQQGKKKVVSYKGAQLVKALKTAGRDVTAAIVDRMPDLRDSNAVPGVNIECMYGVNVETGVGWVYGNGFAKPPTETVMENVADYQPSTKTKNHHEQNSKKSVHKDHPHYDTTIIDPAVQPHSGDGIVNLRSLDYCTQYPKYDPEHYVHVSQYNGVGHTGMCGEPAAMKKSLDIIRQVAEKNRKMRLDNEGGGAGGRQVKKSEASTKTGVPEGRSKGPHQQVQEAIFV
ncbi:unnamed protein product [Amoebophrya sp. A25]|nr:unnamed protein product [Amoebophrya sp. A25]|eukprot:GSA25T00014897001.1